MVWGVFNKACDHSLEQDFSTGGACATCGTLKLAKWHLPHASFFKFFKYIYSTHCNAGFGFCLANGKNWQKPVYASLCRFKPV